MQLASVPKLLTCSDDTRTRARTSVRTISMRGLFKAIVHILGLGALALVSVELVFDSGSRGFLAFDQSILFDGGYRIFLGQIPYRDFFIPTGPVPFWIQGFFFQLFSVNYSAYLLHAAIANLLAVLSAYLWVRCIYPESFGYALLAAAVTAFWFYPPLGTPWFEQTAFLFHFLASLLLFYGFRLAERKRVWTAVLVGASGWMTGLAFLSKQNAGLLSVAACTAIIVVAAPGGVRTRFRFLGSFLTGLTAVALVFGAWLWRFSHPGNFWIYFFVIPHEEGMRRIAGATIHRFLLEEFSAAGANRAVVLACFLAAATALVIHARFRLVKRSGLGEPGILAATTVVTLYLLQALFNQVTLNEPEIGFPFGGVILALGALLVRDLVETGSGVVVAEASSKDSVRLALLPVLAISAALLLIQQGWEVSQSRIAHDIFWRSEFREDVVSKALAPVRWGIPTRAARRSPHEISVDDVDKLAAFLQSVEGNFFIFPDFTVMYGLSGKVPPQPLVWFHPGLTYNDDHDPALDHRIVRELVANDVTHVILEKDSFQGTKRRLSKLPRTRRYIRSRFELVEEIGIFQIHARKSRGLESSLR